MLELPHLQTEDDILLEYEETEEAPAGAAAAAAASSGADAETKCVS